VAKRLNMFEANIQNLINTMLHISETVFATLQDRPVFSINAQLRAQQVVRHKEPTLMVLAND
jgi:hypothetical protein